MRIQKQSKMMARGIQRLIKYVSVKSARSELSKSGKRESGQNAARLKPTLASQDKASTEARMRWSSGAPRTMPGIHPGYMAPLTGLFSAL